MPKSTAAEGSPCRPSKDEQPCPEDLGRAAEDTTVPANGDPMQLCPETLNTADEDTTGSMNGDSDTPHSDSPPPVTGMKQDSDLPGNVESVASCPADSLSLELPPNSQMTDDREEIPPDRDRPELSEKITTTTEEARDGPLPLVLPEESTGDVCPEESQPNAEKSNEEVDCPDTEVFITFMVKFLDRTQCM